MAEHEPGLLRFAMTLAGDHHISEDLVGDTLAMMCEKWDHVASLDHPLAYARRTLVNHYISSCRRKSRWQRAMPKLFSGQRTVGEADSEVGDRLAMRQRLQKLPPRQRAVLAMRYYLDLSDEQIAEQLACGRATVRSHAARGLAALRLDITAPTHQLVPATPAEDRS